MSERRKVPGVETYDGPAGGWGRCRRLRSRSGIKWRLCPTRRRFCGSISRKVSIAQDAPGRIRAIPRLSNSARTAPRRFRGKPRSKRANREFFATNTVSELWNWSDYALENEGRLTEPLVYDRGNGQIHAHPLGRRDGENRRFACARSPIPNEAEFYTSGRASNEAAFLYQLLRARVRHQQFPDCSNMCHEATSVGLPESIGVGKGTVQLEDFDHCRRDLLHRA